MVGSDTVAAPAFRTSMGKGRQKVYEQTCQVSRISRESHAFSLNSRISTRLNIISRILFYPS